MQFTKADSLLAHPWAVMHVARTNLDFDEDVPSIGISDDTETSSFTRKLSEGRKLYRVAGEVWRAEWVEPGARSTRIRGDEPQPPIPFVVNAAGKKQIAKSLIDSGSVVMVQTRTNTRSHRPSRRIIGVVHGEKRAV